MVSLNDTNITAIDTELLHLQIYKFYKKIIIMRITESEWKHILIQMVFENYEQFKKLYAVFMAMENILSK